MPQGSRPDIPSTTRFARPYKANSAAGPASGRPSRVFLVYNTAAYLLRFRSELIAEFQQRGHECHVALPNDVSSEEAAAFARMSVTVHTLRSFVDQRITPIADARLTLEYYRLYTALRPEIVFNFTIKPCIFSSIAARLAGVKRIAAMITGLGYVFTEDTPRGRVMAFVAGLAYRAALRNRATVFFQNTEDCEYFQRRNMVTPRQSVLVNGSGVSMTLFTPSKKPDAPPVFLMVARLLKSKGILEYLEASRITREKLPDARFILVGPFDHNPSGIDAKVLQPYIDAGIIEYQGYLPDPLAAYDAATVYVLPSYAEGRPRTVLEAMACGLAIITTDARGCRETIVDGVNGYLVPAKSAADLSRRMLELGTNPARVREMGLASRRIAEERYDVREVTTQIYEALCGTVAEPVRK